MDRPVYFQFPKESSWNLWTQVLRRSAIDPEFRARLLEGDPREAIKEETGIEIPDDYQMRFVEKPEGVHDVLVLPALIEEPAELTEEELEAVAGGMADCSCTGSGGDCVTYTCPPSDA